MHLIVLIVGKANIPFQEKGLIKYTTCQKTTWVTDNYMDI